MSILRNLVDAKPIELRCVELDQRPASSVTFCQWAGSEWTFAWSRLDAYEYSQDGDGEKVEFFFPNHFVTITGEGFSPAKAALRDFRVSCLRNLPPSYRATFGSGEPFITGLQVKVLALPMGAATAPKSATPFA